MLRMDLRLRLESMKWDADAVDANRIRALLPVPRRLARAPLALVRHLVLVPARVRTALLLASAVLMTTTKS